MRLNTSTPGAPGAPAADPFQRAQAGLEAALRAPGFGNGSGNASERILAAPSSHLDVNTDIYSKALVTAVYLALFAVGTVGNAVTAFTLARKKSLQSLQSTVHYHLGSLALSDLLTLLLAMPVELYNFIWVHHPWAFGDAGCRGYYFVRDACTYATALNVASLSVERYLAICHPFKAKTLMSRSRTKKFISAIWLASGLLAVPMLFTMGQQNRSADGQHPGGLVCTPTVHAATVKIVIQVNTFMSFIFPMVVISVLNTIIANKLTVMVRQAAEQGQVGDQHNTFSMAIEPGRVQALRHGVHVLRTYSGPSGIQKCHQKGKQHSLPQSRSVQEPGSHRSVPFCAVLMELQLTPTGHRRTGPQREEAPQTEGGEYLAGHGWHRYRQRPPAQMGKLKPRSQTAKPAGEADPNLHGLRGCAHQYQLWSCTLGALGAGPGLDLRVLPPPQAPRLGAAAS
ncbi:neurotensin receptor type 1 [Sapajus apella]|uniref:Neurotensin receptor type 1 n=1 Tax=Sapajus apella TaxID=9515 RepID=A0A6J3G4Z1_SAPAP|nr:neurotensin receptor type 1 [Sapajus apella]